MGLSTQTSSAIAPVELASVPSPGWAAVRLRPLTDADVPAIVVACQDGQTQRFTTIPIPYTEQDGQEFIALAASGYANGRNPIFAISTDEHPYAGSIDLRLDGEGGAEVGFAVAPWARCNGVASSALRTICDWGFDALALQRIEWLAFVGNWGSRRTAERVGFQYEGIARSRCVARGVRHDAWVAALLPGDRH
ncbi:RimJ/RimL family protein N-acetyltransferase [Jatrophihabitans sp. GAS493]|uniref:GNAT family N-acetyltransferase n=1 Tax=Jatrophihabitans sp. GAS493 TaxID=1907575 RepID=UPI000BB7D9DC|nr:GNAT family N-acetyltransferase [Jatrophihabitans sp. GAS493]SOD71843.1 RimJ/RimL family protein N-acetyltransferase [Jatrophihabitans sp. GAS493]